MRWSNAQCALVHEKAFLISSSVVLGSVSKPADLFAALHPRSATTARQRAVNLIAAESFSTLGENMFGSADRFKSQWDKALPSRKTSTFTSVLRGLFIVARLLLTPGTTPDLRLLLPGLSVRVSNTAAFVGITPQLRVSG